MNKIKILVYLLLDIKIKIINEDIYDLKNRKFNLYYKIYFNKYKFYIKYKNKFSPCLMQAKYIDNFLFELNNGTFNIVEIIDNLEKETI